MSVKSLREFVDIVGIRKLTKFGKKHSQSKTSLNNWISATRKAKWNNFADIRNTFNSADYYKGAVIFNIGGNNYRLIAEVDFENQNVYIDQVLTHSEYDENRWKVRYD